MLDWVVALAVALAGAFGFVAFERWRRALLETRIDGRANFDLKNVRDARRLGVLLDLPGSPRGARPEDTFLELREEVLSRTRGARIVTDDNMFSEWH